MVRIVLVSALALSIGWGIRGNFGHEHGAMLPGALAALAAVLVAGRPDWLRRVAFFGLYGAIGWSFGGSMSYGHVLGYTHSGDSLTVVYGFACLFVIGFLWAAVGGAGTALPACLTRERLTGLIAPMAAVFAAWALQEALYDPVNAWLAPAAARVGTLGNHAFRQDEPLYWFDSDWTSALLAVVAVLALAAARRRFDEGTSLVLHMALGWWAGFLLFPVLLGWRMTPPRGDNWAGCLGMTVGLWVFLQRRGLTDVTWASLIAGLWGGIGFSLATLFQLLEARTGLQTNWHSILEQTYGAINGVGIGLMMAWLARRAPRVSDDPPVRRWTDWAAPAFVLFGVTYLNARKNPEEWVKAKVMPAAMYGLSADVWWHLGFWAVAVVGIALMVRHLKRPVPLVPATWPGKGQALLLALLWWMVVVNFERALVAFAPQRLVTEGVIQVNAALVTLLVLLWGRGDTQAPGAEPAARPAYARSLVLGGGAAALVIVGSWALTRAVYSGTRPDYRGRELIRFGPRATAVERPAPGQPHP